MNRSRLVAVPSAFVLLVGCADRATAPTNALPSDVSAAMATPTIVTVSPSNLNGECQTVAVPVYCYLQYLTGWLFYNDETDAGDPTLGNFIPGPGTPMYGVGSALLGVIGTERRNLATYGFAGTPLSSITAMSFRTYNPSPGNYGSPNRSAYLNFNVDFDGSDSWQRRLVFVPSNNGAVLQDTWQEWDAIQGGAARWSYSGSTWPGTATSGTTLRTWNDILTSYPGVRIRLTDGHLGLRVGEPYPDGYTENIDSFTFGTASGTTIYDFDLSNVATSKAECRSMGWTTATRADGTHFKNQGDCISYIANGK